MSDDYINKIISINLETLIKKEDVIAVDTIKPQIHENNYNILLTKKMCKSII